jgi:hypothetical protein
MNYWNIKVILNPENIDKIFTAKLVNDCITTDRNCPEAIKGLLSQIIPKFKKKEQELIIHIDNELIKILNITTNSYFNFGPEFPITSIINYYCKCSMAAEGDLPNLKKFIYKFFPILLQIICTNTIGITVAEDIFVKSLPDQFINKLGLSDALGFTNITNFTNLRSYKNFREKYLGSDKSLCKRLKDIVCGPTESEDTLSSPTQLQDFRDAIIFFKILVFFYPQTSWTTINTFILCNSRSQNDLPFDTDFSRFLIFIIFGLFIYFPISDF